MAEAQGSMTHTNMPAIYKSRLHEMTQTTPTCLWNDSASVRELAYSIEHGAVGATCNPVIVAGMLKKEFTLWKDRIQELIAENATETEDQIGWRLVREISKKSAALLKQQADAHGVTVDAWVQALAREKARIDEVHSGRQKAQAAAARILEIQKRVKPDPDGLTVRDYIDHGRP